jgi:hypothetical protein
MAKISQEYLALLRYVTNLPEGSSVIYDDVERDTSVKMDKTSGNRQKLARAIDKSGRDYLPIYVDGQFLGFDMDKKENCTAIVDRRGRRLVSAATKAGKTARRQWDKHGMELAPEQRQDLLIRARVLTFTEKVVVRKTTAVEYIKMPIIPNIEDRK